MKKYYLVVKTYTDEETFRFEDFAEMREMYEEYKGNAIEVVMYNEDYEELLEDGRVKDAVELAQYMWDLVGTWD